MEELICSPVEGMIIPLERVPDDMFAQKMLGDGIAVNPQSSRWYAPVDGVVSVIYETKHAIGITTDQGTELLIHIGLDTYDLKGKPFEMMVHLQDHVCVGDLLMHVDIAYIKEQGYDPIAPVISTNKKIKLLNSKGEVKAGDVLFQIDD